MRRRVKSWMRWWKHRHLGNTEPMFHNMIHLHKELQYHGQAISELTTIMTQLAKAQLNQVQAPKQVNAMEGVNMMVNKRRTKGPQVQTLVENYVQDDGGFEQDDSYNEPEEDVQYVNNFQEQRNNFQCPNQQLWRPQNNNGNWNPNNQGNWHNNNNNQGNWSGNNQGNWVGNNQGGWSNNQGNRGSGFQRPPM